MRRHNPTSTLKFLVFCAMAAAGHSFARPAPSGPPWSSPVVDSITLQFDSASLQVDFGPGHLDLPRQRVLSWVTTAARSVAGYYGRLPVRSARILIQPVEDERGVLQGTTWGDVGGFPAFTRIRIGERTTEQDLDQDWVLTHEMIHAAFPTMSDEHHWIEEGIATYVEPVARAQNGLLRPESIWRDMMRDMPKGDPQLLDRGLDRTHTWGRTYWGGAQFCLMADVEIRRRTGNRKGLQDALRSIVAAGGTIEREWPLERALDAGDQGTGTTVLRDLYRDMGRASKPVDLTKLWASLGVATTDGVVQLQENAPESGIRRAITRKPL